MRKLLNILLPFMVLGLLYAFCTNNDFVDHGGSGTETIGGILVDSTDTPVKGAFVEVRNKTTTFYNVTNAKGEYQITDIKAGTYNLFAYTPDTSLILHLDSIRYIDASRKLDLGKDTMYAPGAISGRVLLNGKSNAGVSIYVPGTSLAAKSDDSGKFIMSNVYPGIYSVYYDYSGYERGKDSNIVVKAGDTTIVATKNLPIDTTGNPPAPENLKASYDTVHGVVTLLWDSVPVKDLKKYEIFRIDSLGNPYTAGFSSAPFFTDTIFYSAFDSLTMYYQVRTIDNLNNKSTFSQIIHITTVSPLFIRTRFQFKPLSDTLLIGVKVKIPIEYLNKGRINKYIRWYTREPLNIVKTDTSNLNQGCDTLVYTWNDSGLYTVVVEAEDDGGCCWRDSQNIYINNSMTIFPPDSWFPFTAMQKARRFSGMVAVDSALYVFGGQEDRYNITAKQFEPFELTTVESYSFISKSWTTLPPMSTPRTDVAAVEIAKTIYVIGGTKSNKQRNKRNILASIEVFNTQTQTWENSISMPYSICGHAALAIHDSIYIFGGFMEDSAGTWISSAIIAFDPKTGLYSTKGSMITGRAYHQVVCRNDSLFILGGIDNGINNSLSSVELYVLGNSSTTLLQPMNNNRMFFGAVALKNMIYVVGGRASFSSDKIYNEMEAYDLITNKWIPRQKLLSPRYGFGCCEFQNLLFIAGGAERATPDASFKIGQLDLVNKYYP